MRFDVGSVFSGFVQVVEQAFLQSSIGLYALAGVALVVCAFLCQSAFRAARTAQQANQDALRTLVKVRDLAVEIRQLAAQAERTSMKVLEAEEQGLSERLAAVRVGGPEAAPDASTTEFAEDPSAPAEPSVEPQVEAKEDDPDALDRLTTAARAASEPSALLRGFIRRRR